MKYDTEARVAAEWWADIMREGFQMDNGAGPSDPTNSPFGQALIGLAVHEARKTQTLGRIKVFQEILETGVREGLERSPHSVVLRVDYHPEGLLAHALRESGIGSDMCSLPWKSTMWVSPGRVKAKQGYGGEIHYLLGDA